MISGFIAAGGCGGGGASTGTGARSSSHSLSDRKSAMNLVTSTADESTSAVSRILSRSAAVRFWMRASSDLVVVSGRKWTMTTIRVGAMARKVRVGPSLTCCSSSYRERSSSLVIDAVSRLLTLSARNHRLYKY